MHLSECFVALKFRNNKLIVLNGVNGRVDIVEEKFWKKLLLSAKEKNLEWLSPELKHQLEKNQYIYTKKGQEMKLLKKLGKKFQKTNKKNLNIAVNFSEACNLACPYCINVTRRNSLQMTADHLSRIWETIALLIKNGRQIDKEITLFGGEPLRLENYKLVKDFLYKASQKKFKIFIFTNGVTIDKYIDILKKYKQVINGFQITVDGPAEIHDRRRIGRNYPKTFDLISRNIDLLLQNKFHIYLRTNINEQNMPFLPKLSQYIFDKQWFHNKYFFPYLALIISNRETEACQQDPVSERMKFFSQFRKLSLSNPVVEKVYKEDPFNNPASDFLLKAINKKSNKRRFAFCTASGGNSYTFAADGKIHACMAAVGINSFILGTYYPKLSWNKDNLKKWENRLSTRMSKCQKCPLVFICAGNCALSSYTQNNDIYNPVCNQAIENLQDFVTFKKDEIWQQLQSKTIQLEK